MSTYPRRRRTLAVGALAVSGLMAAAMGSASAVFEGEASASAFGIRIGASPALPVGTLGTTLGEVSATGDNPVEYNQVGHVALPQTDAVIAVDAGSASAETRVTGNNRAAATASLASVAITPSALLANEMVSDVLAQGRAQLEALRQQAASAQQTIMGAVNILATVTGDVSVTSPVGEIQLGGDQTFNLQQVAQQIVGNAPQVDPVALADELSDTLMDQLVGVITPRLDMYIKVVRTQCTLDADAGIAMGKTEFVFSQGTWSLLQGLNPAALGQLPVTLTAGGDVSVQIPPNTTVSLGGVMTLVLNEQMAASAHGSASYHVDAVHLDVAGLADVTLASSNCELNGGVDLHPQVPDTDDLAGVYVPETNPYLNVDLTGGSNTGNLLDGDVSGLLGGFAGGGNLGLGIGGGWNPSGPLGIKAGPVEVERTLPPLGGRADIGSTAQATLGSLLQLSGLVP